MAKDIESWNKTLSAFREALFVFLALQKLSDLRLETILQENTLASAQIFFKALKRKRTLLWNSLARLLCLKSLLNDLRPI